MKCDSLMQGIRLLYRKEWTYLGNLILALELSSIKQEHSELMCNIVNDNRLQCRLNSCFDTKFCLRVFFFFNWIYFIKTLDSWSNCYWLSSLILQRQILIPLIPAVLLPVGSKHDTWIIGLFMGSFLFFLHTN